LGLAPSLPAYLIAWVLVGAGMGAGLYDAAFGTLGRYFGEDARGAIASLTLFGGFASTVCWPLSAWLVETLGWRGTCLAYVGLHLGMALPAYLAFLPRLGAGGGLASGANPKHIATSRSTVLTGEQRSSYLLLAAIITE